MHSTDDTFPGSETATSPELVLAHLDSLPTLSAIAVRVLQVTAAGDSSAHEVVDLVRNDQSLTAKVLSFVNASAMGVGTHVTTLERAVPLIGFATLRSIVLATSVLDCFGGGVGDGAFPRREFWKHSLGVACASRRLAAVRPEVADPEEAFVAGLLHDLGKVALATVFPKAYERIAADVNRSRADIADAERSIMGLDHTVAGRRLAERWKLPRPLQDVIWLHHLTADAVPESVARSGLIGIVQLADTLVREQRIGYSGNYMFYEQSPALAERLGFTGEEIGEVVRALASDVAAHAESLGLDAETAESLYVSAMMRANQELARLNGELGTTNRRLAAGARYFRAIGEFERALTDWADPAAVLTALTAAAAAALQRDRVAAFGLRAPVDLVDCCWVGPEEHGQETQAVPVDLAAWLADYGHTREPVLEEAPAPVRALVAKALAPARAGRAWMLRIVHDDGLAGAIVYAAETDERARLGGELEELRSFLTSVGLALGRANAQTAARRLSEDLAQTNRRLQRMQVELLRSRALSMIAEMASGAGHELNGPLTVISGRAQMLSPTVDDDAQRVLQMIIEKAHECSAIVTELMDFARPRPPELAPVELGELLLEVRAEWLAEQSEAAGRLRIERVSGAGGPVEVALDRVQVKTVLRELLRNARAAIDPREGVIVLRYDPTPRGGEIELTVEDNGCGMTPAVLQRAFDPFYSHRAAGRERGLGLPRAYRIVEAHGGRIWLESQPGQGTLVHITLPTRPTHVTGPHGNEAASE